MALTAWQRDNGRSQGRIVPAEWDAADGVYVFCLGRGERAEPEPLAAGDFVQIQQDGTLNGRVLRSRIYVMPPDVAPPVGVRWVWSAMLDGVTVIEREVVNEETFADLAMVTEPYGATAVLAFKLLLDAPAGNYLLELPGVSIDGLAFEDPADRFLLANRFPEPKGVAPESRIGFDLFDVEPGSGGFTLAGVTIVVNDVVAYSGGAFTAAYLGSTAQMDVPQVRAARFSLVPVVPFASQQQVIVRVIVTGTGPAATQNFLYDFTMADRTPPKVLAALPIGHRRIRVTFDEAMMQQSAAVAFDALNPANYTVLPVAGERAVVLSVLGVETVSPTEVDLLVNWEQSPSKSYVVTVTNAVDINGNEIVPPDNVASFTGYLCAAPEGRRFRFVDWVPDMNWDEDSTGELADFLDVFQEMLDLALCRIDDFVSIIDPAVAPVAFVEAMLDDLGNPFTFELDEIDKRRLAQVLWSIYQQKGTRRGIVNAIRFFLGIEVTVFAPGRGGELGLGEWELGYSWFLGSGNSDAYTDLEIVVPLLIDTTTRARIFEIADYMRAAWERISAVVQPPEPPPVVDHLELGLSELGFNWFLHGISNPPALPPPVFLSASTVTDVGGQTTLAMMNATADATVHTDGAPRVTYFDSAVQLRADVPAHAVGTVSVEVVQASGSTGVQPGALEYIASYVDPATLNLAGYWEQRTGYLYDPDAVVTTALWPGVPSLGSSGSRPLGTPNTGAGWTKPTLTTAIDGVQPLLYDSVLDELATNLPLSSFATSSAFCWTMLLRISSSSVSTATRLFDANFAVATAGKSGATGEIGFTCSSVSVNRTATLTGLPLDTWLVVFGQFDGVDVKLRANNGTPIVTSGASLVMGTSSSVRGCNDANGSTLTQRLAFAMAPTLTDTDGTIFYDWWKSQYPTAGLP